MLKQRLKGIFMFYTESSIFTMICRYMYRFVLLSCFSIEVNMTCHSNWHTKIGKCKISTIIFKSIFYYLSYILLYMIKLRIECVKETTNRLASWSPLMSLHHGKNSDCKNISTQLVKLLGLNLQILRQLAINV